MSFYELIFGPTLESKAKFPWIFENNSIDRHNCRRVVPMQVLSLGMGRTGTASMQHALQQLGYPTAHGFDMHANKPDCDMWMEAFNAKYHGDTSVTLDRSFWDKLLGHVAAVTDTPCNAFGPELIKSYPDAKVVLVEREVESWYASFERALIRNVDLPILVVLEKVDRDTKRMFPVLRDGIMKGQFHAKDKAEWKANARDVYHQHYAEIRDLLKDEPDRLLEYKLSSGWKPLCDFLGKPVPETEFPRVNETEMHDEMQRVVIVMMVRGSVWKLSLVVGPLVAVYLAWVVYQRQVAVS